MTARLIAKQLRACFGRGNCLFLIGNGGSAEMASHFAAELIHEKLPAISLAADNAVLTSIANDRDFSFIFSDQIRALGKPGDILLTLTTSKEYSKKGHSSNLFWAAIEAAANQMEIIEFPRIGKNTQQIQEKQLVLLHKIWQLLRQ